MFSDFSSDVLWLPCLNSLCYTEFSDEQIALLVAKTANCCELYQA